MTSQKTAAEETRLGKKAGQVDMSRRTQTIFGFVTHMHTPIWLLYRYVPRDTALFLDRLFEVSDP